MSPLRERSLAEYCSAVADRTPTPGGGSVSALVGALAAALAEMASRFSAAKAEDAAAQAALEGALERFSRQREALLAAVDEDCAAYESVRDAMRLPRGTEEERRLRREAIERATRRAMGVPLEAMRVVSEVLEELGRTAPHVRAQLASDLGCAAWCARAALEGLSLNVSINAASLPEGDDEAVRAAAEVERMRGRAGETCEALLARVREATS